MDEYTDEAIDALEAVMRDELRALLLVEDGDPDIAETIINRCHLSVHVWKRLDDGARQDVAWALRNTYRAAWRDGHEDGYAEGYKEAEWERE